MNVKINRIAEVLSLKIEQGKVNLTAKLKGETEPIEISFDYVFQDNAICISEVKANKEWVNGLADIFKEKYSKIDLKNFPVNGIIMKVIEHLL